MFRCLVRIRLLKVVVHRVAICNVGEMFLQPEYSGGPSTALQLALKLANGSIPFRLWNLHSGTLSALKLATLSALKLANGSIPGLARAKYGLVGMGWGHDHFISRLLLHAHLKLDSDNPLTLYISHLKTDSGTP